MSKQEIAHIHAVRGIGQTILSIAPSLERLQSAADLSWFDHALREDAFTAFFQPIVDTRKQEVFAHECLIRLLGDRVYNAGEIIDAAIAL